MAGCSERLTGPESPSNLIGNPGFETNGSPSWAEWGQYENTRGELTDEKPFPGPGYSMLLAAYNGYETNLIYARVRTVPGSHVYRMSCWARSSGRPGKIYLEYRPKGGGDPDRIQGEIVTIRDTVWEFYEQTYRIVIGQGDELYLFLNGGCYNLSPVPAGKTWFYFPGVDEPVGQRQDKQSMIRNLQD